MASSVEALAEAFEGTLRELRSLPQRTFKFNFSSSPREGEVHKSQILDSSFKKQELDFRPWHCGRQAEGSLNKVFDFGSWPFGRQGRKCK